MKLNERTDMTSDQGSYLIRIIFQKDHYSSNKKKMNWEVKRLEIWRFEMFRTSHTVVSFLFNFDTLVKVSNTQSANCSEHRGSKDILNCSFS